VEVAVEEEETAAGLVLEDLEGEVVAAVKYCSVTYL
jgi:hypothetical protein